MAVFPDRIVLKNSTDTEAAITAAIEAGGTDEIQQGEIVIGRESGSATLYTVDANGDIVDVTGVPDNVTVNTITSNQYLIPSVSYGGVGFRQYDGSAQTGGDVIDFGFPVTNIWWGDFNSTLDTYVSFDHYTANPNSLNATPGTDLNVDWDVDPSGVILNANDDINSRLQWIFGFEETSVDAANTDGNIQSYISKNNNGISAISWISDGTANTQSIGHGLGVKPAFIWLSTFSDQATYAFPSIRGDDNYWAGTGFSVDTQRMNSVNTTTFSRGRSDDSGWQWLSIAIAETPDRIVSSTQNGNGSGNIDIDFGFQPAMVIAKSTTSISATVDGMSTSMGDALLLMARTDSNTGYVNHYCLDRDENTVTSTAVQITSTGIRLEPGAPGNNATQEGGGYYFIGIKGTAETISETVVTNLDSIGVLSDVDTSTPPTDGQVLTWVNANSQWEPGVGVTAIDDLTDVDTSTTPPTNGQALSWDNASSQWKPATFAGGVTAIDDLSDVDTSTTPPTNGQALAWDNASSQWKPATFAGGVTAIDDLSDVDTTTTPPTDGQALVWDNANSQWEPGTVSGGGNNYYSDNLWPADSNYANLSLGIHADGNFNDHSTNLFVPTIFGNTAINTNVSRFGSGSIEFDGSGDYVRYAFDTALDLNSASAWTISFWMKPGLTTSRRIMGSGGGTVGWNSTNGLHWILGTSGSPADRVNIQWWDGTGSQGMNSAVGTLSLTGWTHVAATWDGTTIRLFVNGNLEASDTTAPARPSTDPVLELGTIPGENGGGSLGYDGYLDDIYIYKGVAVWTTGFTPPTSPLGTTSGGGLVSLDALSDVDTVTVAPTDGQVLAWDNANSIWEPASLRALLGIGEYVDDTAAGSGGVASGALYYNTTSSDYRLKT